MAKKTTQNYGNESITSLKGADRVRKRPAVIFGSDGIEGCQHSVFEILSNSIDEAREGYGREIIITKYADHSIEIEDFGRGIPVDYNKDEERYNWELVFCELYAGGEYNNIEAHALHFVLKKEKTSADFTVNSTQAKKQGQRSTGNPTWKSLPILISQTTILSTPSSVRLLSTQGSDLCSAAKRTASSKRRNFAMKTVSLTM